MDGPTGSVAYNRQRSRYAAPATLNRTYGCLFSKKFEAVRFINMQQSTHAAARHAKAVSTDRCCEIIKLVSFMRTHGPAHATPKTNCKQVY